MYNFDEVINREGTNCTQWDYVQDRFGQSGLLPFTISDTDFALPKQVIQRLNERMSHPVFGYTRWNHKEFKNSIETWYQKRFNIKIEKDWIYYTPTVIYAISQLIKMKSNENDGVIIQTPAYDAFFNVIKENNRTVVQNDLIYKDGYYSIDFIYLEELLSKSNNKILLLCSPHNPTGRVWSVDELTTLIELCRKHDVYIISDEIHMDIVRKEYNHIPLFKKSIENIAIVTSGSKTFNFPGLLFAYVLIPDLEDGNIFLRYLKQRDGLSSPSIMGMEATITAYNECSEWVEELNNYIDENIKLVQEYLERNLPEIKLVYPESTYLLWLDISGLNMTMDELQERLIKIGNVAIMDGKTYGGNGQLFLRYNIGCPKSKVLEGLNRLKLSIYKG
ncbi:MalY/PatB family protein [Mammaliicoccus lentus]|jgi:cystathionine beta-lyase|uniref:cysteine-S-conjugate beta-lyase n=1 Tax=Mammaliicoccus lentus TaxID=42858 RepID=A0AAX3W7Y7_MAMLE|nr:MalY/PatB family protein [Mammaliicoccus lentus]HBV04700.1 pyridoxal phosphate-dependent aminotransferase [Staphylococcus sp.]MBW0766306.1 pyridoxal phosphate-dependent aminotransferase [Mammaliicoccus lentus]MDQ7142537.1 MalY/PatB family protein [Mammaliicoccus lentus]POA03616.1 pyridoxal phosphate-dependent aminotransferase [Mammaliicoccus lentus]QMU10810.1 pyridoxal phosphate-dependent aminotransferase [Mammaliicoccus lentus]